jgi:beta-glucosidase
MDSPDPSIQKTLFGEDLGSAAHRAIARKAVRESMVGLKNGDTETPPVLPLDKSTKVYLTGSHANNIQGQCGGWTMGWSDAGTITGGTTLQAAFNAVGGTLVTSADQADVVIYAFGENPYAEWNGDLSDRSNTGLRFTGNISASQLATTANGKPLISIFFSGRPRIVDDYIDASDAFIAAWLPGSEGAGIADVLYGDYEADDFRGKLPHPWPGNNGTRYEYGFGIEL